MSGVATGPYVDRLIRIFRDRPSDDTSALVLIDFANASVAEAHDLLARVVADEGVYNYVTSTTMDAIGAYMVRASAALTPPAAAPRVAGYKVEGNSDG